MLMEEIDAGEGNRDKLLSVISALISSLGNTVALLADFDKVAARNYLIHIQQKIIFVCDESCTQNLLAMQEEEEEGGPTSVN